MKKQIAKIFLIRPGETLNGTDRLDPNGAQSIRNLIPLAEAHTDQTDVMLFLSSTASVAEETIEIIATGLNQIYDVHNELLIEAGHSMNIPRAMNLIDTRIEDTEGANALVLVTHHGYLNAFINELRQSSGGDFLFLPKQVNLKKGEMLFIDMHNRTKIKYPLK